MRNDEDVSPQSKKNGPISQGMTERPGEFRLVQRKMLWSARTRLEPRSCPKLFLTSKINQLFREARFAE